MFYFGSKLQFGESCQRTLSEDSKHLTSRGHWCWVDEALQREGVQSVCVSEEDRLTAGCRAFF